MSLVERVRGAILREALLCDGIERDTRFSEITDDEWTQMLQAAIAVVIEEAAKVAERGGSFEAPTQSEQYAGECIARAIRALAKG